MSNACAKHRSEPIAICRKCIACEIEGQRTEIDRLEADRALARRCAELERDLATAHADASHYASRAEELRAEVERLRHALERINARAEAYTEDGRGMTECSTLVVAEIARTALETTK